MAEMLFGFGIYAALALVMIGIGISQRRSRTPVAFYTGEEPLQESELTDVREWNRKHGNLWIAYGAVILLSYLAGMVTDSEVWQIVFACGGVILPLGGMIWRHHRLCRNYLRRKQ